jgi:starvation-inducible outer membrane lipoprotein
LLPVGLRPLPQAPPPELQREAISARSLRQVFSDEDAHTCAEGIRRGGTLVNARVADGDRARFEAALSQSAIDTS